MIEVLAELAYGYLKCLAGAGVVSIIGGGVTEAALRISDFRRKRSERYVFPSGRIVRLTRKR